MKRVLICANPDLNYIDGSSVWAQTIALAVAATCRAEVDFLARSTPQRDELFAPLKAAEHITIIDGSDRRHWHGSGFTRLTPSMMGELAVRLDRDRPYDVIVVRGMAVADQLLDAPDVLARSWLYLTDIPQRVGDYSAQQRATMQRLAKGCRLLLCQSDGFRDLWQALVPDLGAHKLKLYTPVIPDLPAALPPIAARPLRAIYAGKFKGDWMTLEMAEQWPAVHRQVPGSELVMIGDKIDDEPDRPDFKPRMTRALKSTPGLTWLGGRSREAVQHQLQQARVGLSWRVESMNATVEYSTKILEYGRTGCAAIINRNPLHEQLLGPDYPLYANSAPEFARQLARALSAPDVAQQAAARLTDLAGRHTFSARVDELRQWLSDVPKAPKPRPRTRVLVAGHDLKFFTPLQKRLEATGQFEFLVDQWQHHDKHDEARSRALLEQADVIFCEWCMGNLKWYSHNKKPHQRLVARFHLQEREKSYVAEANWDAIDHISYVSEFIRREGQKAFGFPLEKTSVIPNFLDDKKFTPRKKTADARYTLGMIGVAPARKRLDRALDLLEALLKENDRYCLRIKGRHPLQYNWLFKREDELAYYRDLFRRINSHPRLRHKVIFDPPGDDVNNWFSMVGFILSPSDFESFHMAVGEGILTGATPVVWDWDGAAEIWGEEWVVNGTQAAAQRISLIASGSRPSSKPVLPAAMTSRSIVSAWLRTIVAHCANSAVVVG